jgi:uncharacterized protein (TIGR02444 family)
MPMTETPTPPPQWTFALQLYARREVAEACLLLQARCHVDVVVMLHAMYVFRVLGAQLERMTLEVADAQVRSWREQVTMPLRQLRTALKAGSACIPATAVEAVREKIKTAELETESAAFAALASFTNGVPVSRANAQEQAETLLKAVIALYSGGGSLEQRSVQALQTLCRAIAV